MQGAEVQAKKKQAARPADFYMPRAPDTTVTKLYTDKVSFVWDGAWTRPLLLMAAHVQGPCFSLVGGVWLKPP